MINKKSCCTLKNVEKELREMRKVIDTKNAEIECLNIIHESYKDMVEENNFISKDKIKSKIEELEKEQEDNRKSLYNAVNNLNFKEIDKISNRICVNMTVRGILQSLFDKKED